jgi:hypothetical protein
MTNPVSKMTDPVKGQQPMLAEPRRATNNGRRSLITGHWSLCLACLFITLATGCRLAQQVANVPGQAIHAVTPGSSANPAADPVEVQQRLMRFSDEYLVSMVYGLDKLRLGTNPPAPAELLKWKILLGTETCSIASGPNAVANLLDMTIFITVTRRGLEEYWQPKVFGESALPMLDTCRGAETNIWQFTSQVLTPQQLTELQKGIDTWFKQHPLPENVLAARAVGFASEVGKANPVEESKPGSVFGLLMLDPLAGMDPAVREIAQTRLLAERALYVSQKMPTLLRWQTELLTLNAVQMPAVQQLVSNSTQIAASVDRFAAVAEKLPDQVSAERTEILKALQSQEKDLASLMVSGTEMSISLNTTLTTFDALMKRFGVGETNSTGPAPTNAEPFRIQDYTQTAAQLEATAKQLTELLVTLDQTLGSTNLAKLTAQVGPVVQQAQTSSKEVVDYAFRKGVLLVAIVLLAALIFRFLAGRLAANNRD